MISVWSNKIEAILQHYCYGPGVSEKRVKDINLLLRFRFVKVIQFGRPRRMFNKQRGDKRACEIVMNLYFTRSNG